MAEEQNMRVIVRVRPLSVSQSIEQLPNNKEKEASDEINHSDPPVSSGKMITLDEVGKAVTIDRDRKGVSAFSFSSVLGTSATQESLYDLCKDSITDVMHGINCSILAYGQTGSGKTYSMLGKGMEDGAIASLGATGKDLSITVGDEDDSSQAHLVSENVGIVPRCIADMFAWIEQQHEVNAANSSSLDYSITATYLQIYNEKLYDLLQDRNLKHPLHLRDAEKGAYSSVYVRGLSEYRVRSEDEVVNLLLKGLRNRATRATELNNESSRSHTILQLFVQVHGFDGETGLPVLRRSTFSFVDLAGSEKWRSNLTQAGNSQLDVQKEMTNINTSLHALGNCVSALIEPGRKHIPYRDSLLTRLLRDSLGGENDNGARGKSVLIATIREDESMVDETYSTLQFASRASKIKTVVKPGASDFMQFHSTGNMTLDRAKQEIALLRDHINHLEGANLKRIEQANNPMKNSGNNNLPVPMVTSSDAKSLCKEIESMLATRLAMSSPLKRNDDDPCKGCNMLTDVLQSCHIQVQELFQLLTVAPSTLHVAPEQQDTSGYTSDNSQSSLSKKHRHNSEAPKSKKKSKKSSHLNNNTGKGTHPTAQVPPRHSSPQKQKHHSNDGGSMSTTKHSMVTKRKASSASAALDKSSAGLNKKTPGSKKDKDGGVSLPLLKSNSAGTYGKAGSTRAQASLLPKHTEDIYRQKKVLKKKKLLEGVSSQKKKALLGHAPTMKSHNNRYQQGGDDLDDDLLGIINDDSDDNTSDNSVVAVRRKGRRGRNLSDQDDDSENDEEIMRRMEEENQKIIQAEDLARENQRKAAGDQQNHHSRNRSRDHQSNKTRVSRDHQQPPSPRHDLSSSRNGVTMTHHDNSIESILAASRNAVLAANGALSHESPSKQHKSHEQANYISPARRSVAEDHRLSIKEQQQAEYQERNYGDSYTPSTQQYHQQHIQPTMNQDYTVEKTYSINTSYNNFSSGVLAMPPSSMDNGAGGFGSKCSKHGLESCVLCTMFNAPGSVKSTTVMQYNATTPSGVGGITDTSSARRSIHSPIKSNDEGGGGDVQTPSHSHHLSDKVSTGFCSIHHVNDCLLCSLTSHSRLKNPSHHSGINMMTSSSPNPNNRHSVEGPPSATQRHNINIMNNDTPVHEMHSSGLNSGGGLNSNTTAPGMFTASPNRQHNFNGFNNTMSLASSDGVYAFGQTDSSLLNSSAVNNSNLTNVAAGISSQPGSVKGNYRNRFPPTVQSSTISEENERDLDGQSSNNTSHASVEFNEHMTSSMKSLGPSDNQPDGKKTHSSVEEFEALLSSMNAPKTMKTEAIPSKYSNLPRGGGIQFEDESDDIAPSTHRRSAASHSQQQEDTSENNVPVRTDHRRGNAMNRNSQSGLYEYDYKSKVEYLPEPQQQHNNLNEGVGVNSMDKISSSVGSKSKQKPLNGANASAASVYGNDMSQMINTDNKKAKKKQMNRKLFEMQKQKNK